MGIQVQKSLQHWNYFLALETDIEHLSRYVEFTEENFSTYSLEIAHIYLACCSEVDVVAKLLCQQINHDSQAGNIGEYREIITAAIPEIPQSLITIPRFGMELNPWQNWQEDKSPIWWQNHNNVKHQRNEFFHQANLHNVLNSMAGLFLLVLVYYRKVIEGRRIEPPPSLFTPPPGLASVMPSIGGRMALFYAE